MKTLLILIIHMTFIASTLKGVSQNIFSEENDTIVLNATKTQNKDFTNKGKMEFYTKNGWVLDTIFPEVIGIPDTLSDISIKYMYFNFDQAILQAYNSRLIDKAAFDRYFQQYNLGQYECINEYVKTFVSIALGYNEKNEKYYILDSNNDFDFSNDKCISVNEKQSSIAKINGRNIHTHKIKFENVLDGEIYQDSTWISLDFKGDKLLFYFSEYTSSEFLYDSIKYNISAFPSDGPFVNYGSPSYFEIGNNTNSILKTRYFNEYIKLNNSYYRITCNSNGRKIKLIKENDAIRKGGTQYFMPPITFTALDLNGDSINFPQIFKNKYILLDFWSTSCAPCVHAITSSYKELYKKYGNQNFEIVGVADNSPEELKNFIEKHDIEWTIIPDGTAKRIQNMYQIYQYPTLFLINSKGNIIAKDNELGGNKLEKLLDELINN